MLKLPEGFVRMVSPTSAWQFSHADLLGLLSRQETSRTKGNISFCMFLPSFFYLLENSILQNKRKRGASKADLTSGDDVCCLTRSLFCSVFVLVCLYCLFRNAGRCTISPEVSLFCFFSYVLLSFSLSLYLYSP